jgi:hypothetical protein
VELESPQDEAREQWVEARSAAEALLWQAEATRQQAGLMSRSVQAEVLRKIVAAEEQKLIERAVRIGHKMRQPAALRNWYKIPAWHYP